MTKITAGREFGCALVGQKASCWGRNSYGQVGAGTKTSRTSPTAIKDVTAAIDIAAGAYHTCAIATDGKLWCWGYNYRGQLGDGTTTHNLKAVQVKNLADVASVDANDNSTCALLKNGKLYCWGENRNYKFDPNAKSTSTPVKEPVEVGGFGSPIVSSSIARYHLCAIAKDGSMLCAGNSSYGALMNGPPPWSYTKQPQKSTLKNVVSVDTGQYFTCAVLSDKSLWCGGQDSSGQLGSGKAWAIVPTEANVY